MKMNRTAAGILLIVILAVIICQQRRVRRLVADGDALRQQQTSVSEQIQQLTYEREKAVDRLAALREENERLARNTAQLLKLREEGAQSQRTVALQSTEPA